MKKFTKTGKVSKRWMQDAQDTLSSRTIERMLEGAIVRHPENAAEYRASLARTKAYKEELAAEVLEALKKC